MPALKKFDANVASHVKLINKNLCADIVRHDYIVTGRTKAKRAQPVVERFLARALAANRSMGDVALDERIRQNAALNFLHPPHRTEIGARLLGPIADRYPVRTHGFTRIIRLEPRLGEDKAPMSVLELVDSEYQIKYWYHAKVVARLELQGLAVDDLTAHNVRKLTQYRENGESEFRAAVETAKKEFFKVNEEGQVVDEAVKKNLENLPRDLEFHGGSMAGKVLGSKKYGTVPRAKRDVASIPPSPFLRESGQK